MSPRRRPRSFAVALLVAGVPFAGAAHADVVVELRGGGERVRASGATADLAGLTLRIAEPGSPEPGSRESGSPKPGSPERREIVPWDFVRGIEGSTAVAGEYLEIGEDLWRARIRVERGDAPFARALVARHWERLRGASGPTAALAAEVLLRCALEDLDLRAAAEPWLAVLRHREAGEPTRFPTLAPVVDEATGLLPAFSPFVPLDRRADLAGALDAARGTGGDAPARIASTLARIMRWTVDGAGAAPAAPARDAAPAERALGLLEAIVAAPDARDLTKALVEFDRAFPEMPPFLGAWRLAAAGAQAARLARATGGDADARRLALERAALELLAVPASGLDKTGLVDAYALEEAEALLREAGDAESAAQLAALRAERLGGPAAAGAPSE
ncbi:MAG: hypothetical protein RI967_1609 [Planctomycetota bacterium]